MPFVQDLGTAGGTTPGTATLTTAVAAAVGHAIIVCATVSASSTQNFTGCTDSAGNTYTLLRVGRHGAASVQQAVYMATDIAALPLGGTITVTHNNTANNIQLVAFEWTELAAVDDAQIGAASAAAGTTYDSGTETVPTGDHLLFSLCTSSSTNTFTPTGSGTWIPLTKTGAVASQNRRGNPFYQETSGGGTLRNTGTVPSSNWLANAIAIPLVAPPPPPTDTGDRIFRVQDATTKVRCDLFLVMPGGLRAPVT